MLRDIRNKAGGISWGAGLALALVSSHAAAFNEAPQLSKLVKEGKLPAVEKRLPENPEVVKPLEKVGTYGGTLRNALRGNGDTNAIVRFGGPNGLLRWNVDFSAVVLNLAESYTLSPDAKEFTFRLRKGTKWSDGAPFTTDDILFAVNDVLANRQFFTAPPSQYTNDGKMVVAEKIDDLTVKFKFSTPFRTFAETLASPIGQHPVMYPKHYCGQFHPKYNPKVGELVKSAKAQDWAALLRAKCGDVELITRWGNTEKPTLDPWVMSEAYVGGATKVVMKRNPYFWQVDTAGNQLPYIDQIQFSVISEIESIVLAAINGQLDFQVRHISSVQNRPLVAENATKGGYKLLALPDVNASPAGLFINQSTKNAKLRDLMRNKDFRVALSLAMDRKEINDIVFLGQGEPWQTGPLKQHRLYNEKLGKQFTNYDLKTANELLDKLGLTKRDAQGMRLYPDGSGKVSINTIVSIALTYQIETLEIIRKQWAKAGIDLVIQSSERSLYYDRGSNNEYDISMDVASGGLDPTQNPRTFLAIHPVESRQSLLWAKWYETHGKAGEDPPASMKKRFKLYDDWKDAKTDAEADALFKQILAIAADELEVLGTVTPPPSVGVLSKKIVNVFDKMPNSWTYAMPGPALVQQWFFSK